MGRFDYEKKGTRWGGPGGAKGQRASPKSQFRGRCNTCGGSLPCRDSDCRKARGAERHSDYKSAKTKRAKKKVAQDKSGWCPFVLLGLLAVPAGLIYGIVEIVNSIMG